ncbi:L-threonylcarbamoyladenylate synthase [Candidatus Berkiella aquae]|uniref:Threonylcarbamoyl-AMP synthase n=1 Tax=Candidatus Berkiella aquae TaxID=295108 RepID=A0A0Q9YW11_9GAMM|nr:L-threonylcarbamoyladenylate synthase [Candidatus Berkiella aquae]MCS5711246.1 threonylcarbamoyl-AMP synthase [Candidatus Berkiella aquae]
MSQLVVSKNPLIPLDEAVCLIKAGSVVAIPTETVYGLAADISQQSAVKQIFSLKGRPENHPLIIHISAITQLETYAIHIPDYVYLLANHFWPGPLTFVLYKSERVGDWVTGGQDTVGIRMPNHPTALALIERVGSPLAAPSANQFGKISPTHPEHVMAEFGDKVSILDGGMCDVGIESTIIDATCHDACTILRPGMVSKEAIQAVLRNNIAINAPGTQSRKVSGTLKSHYSPNKPAFLFEDINDFATIQDEHETTFGIYISPEYQSRFSQGVQLPNNPLEYAKIIYESLRLADQATTRAILIECPPKTKEWTAILDRLERSCAENHSQIDLIY